MIPNPVLRASPRRRLGALAAALLLVLAAAAPPARAQRVTLDMPEVTQALDVWCWVAVAEMLVTYYRGRAPMQCRMLEIGYGLPKGRCCGDPGRCRRPGHLEETQRLIEHFSGQAARVTGPPDGPAAVARALGNNRAIVAAILPPRQPVGHLVVIRGIRRARGQAVELLVNDPTSRVPATIPWSRFRPLWRQSIIVQFDPAAAGAAVDD